MKRKSDKNTSRAFGLIETLIACAILIIITGALLALNVVITNGVLFSKQRAQAYNLAQEGIESVKQIRNTNYLDGDSRTNWNSLVCKQDATPLIQAPNLSGTYIVSSTATTYCSSLQRFFLIPRNTGENVSLDGSVFNRKITFQESGLDPKIYSSTEADIDITEENAIRIIVTVSWTSSGRDQQIQLKSVLTNWKQAL